MCLADRFIRIYDDTKISVSRPMILYDMNYLVTTDLSCSLLMLYCSLAYFYCPSCCSAMQIAGVYGVVGLNLSKFCLNLSLLLGMWYVDFVPVKIVFYIKLILLLAGYMARSFAA